MNEWAIPFHVEVMIVIDTKVSLFDLVPMELYELHSEYYQLLIIGYFKNLKQENELHYPEIPSVLKELVVLYYPALL